MKVLLNIFDLTILFFISCNDCTWVSTGYYHKIEGEYVEEGYWDCSDENPASYDLHYPEIKIEFNSKTERSTKINSYTCTIKLYNRGDAEAKNVHCKLIIKRSRVPGVYDNKTIIEERTFELIYSLESRTYDYRFSDIPYTGCCMFSGSIEVTYNNSSGKSYSVRDVFEL